MAENKGIELKTIESASAPVAELDSKYQSVDSPPPVVAWSNIEVRSFSILDRIKVLLGSKVEGKRILNGISGQIERGLWGILGASGSGKTTLLNVLGKREDFVRTTVTGTATLGGEIYQRRHLKAIAGYVLQDDVLHSQFTVYETLWFHSFLRLSGALSAETIKSRIEDALNLLQIDHTRNTIVGDTRRKGISGGERKRLAIALELIPRPKILFLDEPTSGLDSSTALVLVKALRGLADSGETTVISTIHQPPTKVYALIENVVLMRNGDIVYTGPAGDAVTYFTKLGFPLKDRTNPADYLLDIIARDLHGDKGPVELPTFVRSADSIGSEVGYTLPVRKQTIWPVQFALVVYRALLQYWRQPFLFWSNIVLAILIAVIATSASWYQIGNGQTAVSKYAAIIFFSVVHQGLVFSFQSSHAFPGERAIMLRERAAGAYRASSYILGKVLADAFVQLPACITFSSILYTRSGLVSLPGNSIKFRLFLWFNILACQAAVSMATAISCVFLSTSTSVVVLAISWEITRLFGGWFVSPLLYHHFKYWKWLDAISYIKYAYVGMSLSLYDDLKFQVLKGQSAKGATLTGLALIKKYGLDEYTISDCVGGLIGLIIGFRLISYLALKFIKI